MPTDAEIEAFYDAQVAQVPAPQTGVDAQMDAIFAGQRKALPVQQLGPRPNEGFGETLVRAVLETPEVVKQMPKGIGTLLSDYGDIAGGLLSVAGPVMGVPQSALRQRPVPQETIERALRATGGIAGSMGGAGAGAKTGALVLSPLGPLGMAAGAGAGGLVGGGLGYLGFKKGLQAVGVDEPTTAKEDIKELGYDIVQGGALGAAGKALQQTGRTLRGTNKLLRTKKALQELAEQSDELPIKLDLPEDELARLKTASELTGDPGLQKAELNIQRLVPELDAQEALKRQGKRLELVEKVLDPELLDEQATGQALRKGAKEVKEVRKTAASGLYDQVSTIEDINLQKTSLSDDILKIDDELRRPKPGAPAAIKRTGKVDKDLAKFQKEVYDLSKQDRPVSLMQLEELQREAKTFADEFRTQGGKSYLLANKLGEAINKTMDTLPEGASAKLARTEWRKFKTTFDELFGGEATKKNKYGRELTRASDLPKRALRSPEDIDSFMEIAKDSPVARTALSDHIAEQFINKLESISSPQGSVKITRWWKSNRGQFKKVLDEDSITFMDRVVDDVKSARAKWDAAKGASQGISDTAALKLYDKHLKSIVGGTTADFLKSKGELVKKIAFAAGALFGWDGGAMNALGLGTMGALSIDALSNQLKKVALKRQTLVLEALRDPKVYNQVMSAKTLKDIPVSAGVPASVISRETIGAEDENTNFSDFRNSATSKAMEGARNLAVEAPTQQIEVQEFKPSKKQYSKADIKALVAKEGPVVQAMVEVESNYNPRAKSKAGALGLAQLMPANIKAFNIKDPFNPEESLRGMKALLTEELERFGDPLLAIAAYNAGSPAINRAIKKAGSSNYNDIQRHLPKETRDYVLKVVNRVRKRS